MPQPIPTRLQAAVTRYVGRKPRYRSLRVLDPDEWKREVGEDSVLFGGTAAMFTTDEDILVRKGFEGDALHELVHAAGVQQSPGQTAFVMEGMAQAAAEDIGRALRVPVRQTYRDEVSFIRKYLVPATGKTLKQLVRLYVTNEDFFGAVADGIMQRHGSRFLAEDWGAPRESIREELRHAIGPEPHLAYLVDELGVGGKRDAVPSLVNDINGLLAK
jgi:hypothetical protein